MDTIPPPMATKRLDPDQSPIPEHASIFRYWDELRGDRIAPSWSEFDLLRLDKNVLPWTAVVDISDDRKEIVYRFWGTELREYRGEDYTNCSVLEIPPQDLGEFIFDSYLTTANEKKPCLDIEEYMAPSGRIGTKAVLRLPLSDDGETINKVVANMVFDISYIGTEVVDFFKSVRDD